MLTIHDLHYRLQQRTLAKVREAYVAPGELIALLGPNGAGKSTLLRLLAREIYGDGTISFHGKALQDWSRLPLARHLAVLPQSSQLAFPFTAIEVVALGLTPLRIRHREGMVLVQHAMQQTDCWHLATQSFVQLSGGERQRVQLARVLVQLSQAEQEPLLLLDEPVSAQDIRQQHMVLQLARSLSKQNSYGIITILHDMNHALHYADKVWLMEKGEMVGAGLPQYCLEATHVERIWGYRPQWLATKDGKHVMY